MLHDHKLTETRIQRFIKHCLEPARFIKIADLKSEVYECEKRCSISEALKSEYKPIALGYNWGPAWSTAWFRMSADLPADVRTDSLYAFIDTNTEACIWSGKTPYHGLSRFHKRFPLDDTFIQNGKVDILVEAAANQLFGLELWEPQYPGQQIGLLQTAHLAVIQPEVNQLYYDFSFALELVATLEENSTRRRTLVFALNKAINLLDGNNPAIGAEKARESLKPHLQTPANASTSTCHAVGHAHIDVAWLWPVAETRRKCYRTFSTALRNMERYPEYRFQQGQAALYRFAKEDVPEIFDQIRKRVEEGKWDAGGAMWVEPDCNLVSGESLVRQIIHGVNFWRDEFGVEQSYLWLPDTFGYSTALPQILNQAGITNFYTQKISWNQFNRFPHHTFWWSGLDGSKVLAHFLTSDTYNSNCTPKELTHSERAFKQNDRCSDWLYAYGWGDGGGGPTDEMLEMLRRSENCEGMPLVRQSTVTEFTKTLNEDNSEHLPTWDGELYLEYHRGTLTTQAANKLANRQAELRLRDTEILFALGPQGMKKYPSEILDECWKILLLNQFHDILPGSSITQVYADSKRDYAMLNEKLEALEETGLTYWAEAADTSKMDNPIVAVNTLGWQRSEVVELPSGCPDNFGAIVESDGKTRIALQASSAKNGQSRKLALLRDVDPLGHRVFDLVPLDGSEALLPKVTASSNCMENDFVRLELNDFGQFVSLFDKEARREVLLADNPANQLVIYEDRPNDYDAWDIDIFYLEQSNPVTTPVKVTIVEPGPLRATLKLERDLGDKSKLIQYVRLTCVSSRIDCETHVEWHEDHKLLRTLFPVDLRNPSASYQMQFGHVERPTHFNTSWDLAKFEACGHHWCDLSEPGFGVALLSDCKYGYSCHGNVLGLSLLRSPTHPDPIADRGSHKFIYSLLPHAGRLTESDVIRGGYELNVPLKLVRTSARSGTRAGRYSAITCDQPNIIIDTVKKAERDDRLIVRMYEAHGRRGPTELCWDPQFGKAKPVNLLEQNCSTDSLSDCPEAGTYIWQHRPFGLYTIAIE